MGSPTNPTPTITNVRYPQSPFLDPLTQKPAREWLIWLQNPQVISQTVNYVVITGGTIDNTVIGATTPAAGYFTTLNAIDGIGGGTF
jgi:hypothetical protein